MIVLSSPFYCRQTFNHFDLAELLVTVNNSGKMSKIDDGRKNLDERRTRGITVCGNRSKMLKPADADQSRTTIVLRTRLNIE